MSDAWAVLLTVALLACNAFFVAAEFSLVSARRDRLAALQDAGKKRAGIVLTAGEHLSRMLAGAQLGITICSILLGKVGEPAVAHLIEKPLDLVGAPDGLLHPIAFVVALILVAFFHILLGEMVPKNLAITGPERAAMVLVPIHLGFVRLARPFIAFYNWCANAILRLLGVSPKDELDATVSVLELSEMIGESREEGLIDDEEHRRLTLALRTAGRTVAEVMIPLAQVRTIPMAPGGPTLGSVEEAVAETGYSRYPVRAVGGGLSGYLHLKDVLPLVLDERAGPDTRIPVARVRPLPRVRADAALDEALASMRGTHSHLGAVVRDVPGRPTALVGILAMEDLVEEFVGTVRDSTHRFDPPTDRREA